MFAFKLILSLFLVLSTVGHVYSLELTSEYLNNEVTEFSIIDQDLKHLVRTKKMINETSKKENENLINRPPPTTESSKDNQNIPEKKDASSIDINDLNDLTNLGNNNSTTEDRKVFNPINENPNSDITYSDRFKQAEEETKKKDEEINSRKKSEESSINNSDDFSDFNDINDKGSNNEMPKNNSTNDQSAIIEPSKNVKSKIIGLLISDNLKDKPIELKSNDEKLIELKSNDEKLIELKSNDEKLIEEKSNEDNSNLKGANLEVREFVDSFKESTDSKITHYSTDDKSTNDESKDSNHKNHLNKTMLIASSSATNSKSIVTIVFCSLITYLIV